MHKGGNTEHEVLIGIIEAYELYLIRADKLLEGKEPYFKFYDSDELEASEHVARISFTRVGYIEGGEDGMQEFRLNKDQVRAMVEFFEDECQEENYREFTYWQYGIVQYNKENVEDSRDWKDVTKKYLKEHAGEFEGRVVLPIDLEMPDYLRLHDSNADANNIFPFTEQRYKYFLSSGMVPGDDPNTN